MARFYGSLKGARGEATRLGHQSITTHVRGWNVGARVDVYIDDHGNDRVDVYATGGSNDSSGTLLCSYSKRPDKLKVEPATTLRETAENQRTS